MVPGFLIHLAHLSHGHSDKFTHVSVCKSVCKDISLFHPLYKIKPITEWISQDTDPLLIDPPGFGPMCGKFFHVWCPSVHYHNKTSYSAKQKLATTLHGA